MTRTRYTMYAGSQGKLYAQRQLARHGRRCGHSPFAHAICVQPHEDERKTFTVGLSDPLIEVDAVVHEDCPDAAIDGGTDMPVPLPDYHVLWPGKPTTNTVWTAVEDYTWFEAFSEEGCATGIACTPAPHLQSERETEDGRRKER